ncbi:hypothetical protein ACFT2C_06060 [Promicromonospora sp. NPDC057138]|uniref:hypothetical protein n=1 Tax=Promicromonospora sp. NPDC057138 TaxID=3346031 RepID=UPI003640BFDC
MRDYDARLRELAGLMPGWLGEGRGAEVSHAALAATRGMIQWVEREQLPEPWIYPTEGGVVQLEWEQAGGIEVVVAANGYEVRAAGVTERTECIQRARALVREVLHSTGIRAARAACAAHPS